MRVQEVMTTLTAKTRFSQAQVVDFLQAEGFDIEVRTLEYWRQEGFIPKLHRDGNERFYTEDDIYSIEIVCAKNGRAGRHGTLRHSIDGEKFIVTRMEVFRVDDRLILAMTTVKPDKREGILVREFSKKEKEEFYAFAGIDEEG